MNILGGIFDFIFPIWNKFTVVGMILFVLGLVLTPIIIGIPILVVGLLLGSFGIYWGIFKGILKLIPNGEARFIRFKKYIIDSYKPYFRKIKK